MSYHPPGNILMGGSTGRKPRDARDGGFPHNIILPGIFDGRERLEKGQRPA